VIGREIRWVLVGAEGLEGRYSILNSCDFLRLEDGLEDSEDGNTGEREIARTFLDQGLDDLKGDLHVPRIMSA